MSEDKTYSKLLSEFKTKWLEALRSGKYNQGQMYLRQHNKFCCLGVACELIDPMKWLEDDGSHLTWDLEDGILPQSTMGIMFQNSADISSDDWNHTINRLIDMNDNCKSFLEIADWIEKNL